MTQEAAVLLEIEGNVATITLNRPERKNAMNAEGWTLLHDYVREIAHNDDVRCVVLQGAGGDFCSGADISSVPGGHPLTRVRNISRTAEVLFGIAKPVIAKVRGYAVGAGWNMTLCCDLVVASDNAKFSQVFTRRGLSLDFGGSWLLSRHAGLQQAKRLAFLADIITAKEAHELGLVTKLVADDELDTVVDQLAARLAAMPPIAIAQTKELLNAGVTASFRDALDNESRAQTINYATDDAPTAFAAFRDKTEAEFTGKWSIR